MALIKCPECGKEVAETALTCPNCGVKISNGHTKKANQIVIICLLVFAACCSIGLIFITLYSSNSDSPQLVNEAGNSIDSAAVPSTSTEQTAFQLGDTVEYDNVQITVLSYSESSGTEFFEPAAGNVFLYPVVEIANNSDKEIDISSLLNFDCYCDDYTIDYSINASIAATAEDLNELDGSIAPGKKMKGVVALEVPADWNKVELYYRSSVWFGSDFIFEIKK